jgi:autotransporter passenger strand-loop-strand repeat protein
LLSLAGHLSGGAVLSGGVIDLFAGADANTTLSGGELLVLNGASASNLVVQSGGLVVAGEFGGGTPGGTLTQGTVAAGGTVVLGEQSQADGLTVGGTLLQLTGVTSAVTLTGTEFVATTLFGPAETAVASATTVKGAGLQIVNAQGSAVGSIIMGGGELLVSSGGVADGAMVSSGGVLVSVSGEISSTVVFAGGVADLFAGTGAGATVSGGSLLVLNGAVESGVDVRSGGLVLAGTFAGGTVGGTIDGGVVSSGGLAVMGTASVISGTTIQRGGILFELAGQASLIGLAGLEYVGGGLPGVTPPNPPPAAIATNTTVSSGGEQIVNSNGSAVDTSVLSGGEIVVNGGMVSGLSLASGALIDVPSLTFSNAISLSFIENASNTGGTLTVSFGTGTHSVDLLGQYVAGGLHLSQDTGTGTAITYAPISSASAELTASHHG